MEFEFLIDNELHTLSLERKEDAFVVSDGKKTYEVDIQYVSPNALSILIKGQSHLVYLARDEDKKFLSLEGQQFIVQDSQAGEAAYGKGEEKSAEDELLVKAPMPGKVIKINVSENEEVRKNQTLAIVEAMKMENEIKSTIEGYVKKILAAPGDLVDSEKPIIELAPKD